MVRPRISLTMSWCQLHNFRLVHIRSFWKTLTWPTWIQITLRQVLNFHGGPQCRNVTPLTMMVACAMTETKSKMAISTRCWATIVSRPGQLMWRHRLMTWPSIFMPHFKQDADVILLSPKRNMLALLRGSCDGRSFSIANIWRQLESPFGAWNHGSDFPCLARSWRESIVNAPLTTERPCDVGSSSTMPAFVWLRGVLKKHLEKRKGLQDFWGCSLFRCNYGSLWDPAQDEGLHWQHKQATTRISTFASGALPEWCSMRVCPCSTESMDSILCWHGGRHTCDTEGIAWCLGAVFGGHEHVDMPNHDCRYPQPMPTGGCV